MNLLDKYTSRKMKEMTIRDIKRKQEKKEREINEYEAKSLEKIERRCRRRCYKLKNEGKRFEEDFKKSVPEQYFVYRFKDGTANFNGAQNENVRFQAHNICDFQVFAEDKLFLFELKSYNGVSIPLSGIRKNQIEGMINASEFKNVRPYFLFNFRPLQKVYAVKIQNVQAFIEKAERRSIPVKWCIENGIEIIGVKKKVRFRYELENFLKE